MSLGPVIDVAIGLIFIYVLLGLIATTAQELVANVWQWRGFMLKDAVAELLAEGDKTSAAFRRVFDHGLIRGLSSDRLPSYIPAQKFALAVIDTLSDGSQAPVFTQIENGLSKLPQGLPRDSLLALVKDAAGDVDALKVSLGTWYDDAMDRVSGFYKRRSQIFAIGLGLAIAVVLNVDSVRIADRLWRDENLRNNIQAAAQAYVVSHGNEPGTSADAAGNRNSSAAPATGGKPDGTASAETARKNLDKNVSALTDLKLPIGWDDVWADTVRIDENAKRPDPAKSGQLSFLVKTICAYIGALGIGGTILLIVGWIITGIATSFGAPFWFDLLKNVINLRSSGPVPKRMEEVS